MHVLIRPNFHKFLALTCWKKLFFFRSLPFRLAPAPWLFSALMEQALNQLRKQGIQVLGYIDDLIFWHQDKDTLSAQVAKAMVFLDQLGLTINVEKSNHSPTSSLTWLGVVWHADRGTWFPQQRLLQDIQSAALALTIAPKSSRRSWESLQGSIAFVAQINARVEHWAHNLARLSCFDHKTHRDVLVALPQKLKYQLPRWVRIEKWIEPEAFGQLPLGPQCWTDASTLGWGILGESGEQFQGIWSEADARLAVRAFHGGNLECRPGQASTFETCSAKYYLFFQ